MTSPRAVQPPPPNTAAGRDAPLDLAPMRAVATELLDTGATLPRFDELADRADQLRRCLRDLVPAVETAARALPVGDGPRVAALLAVENTQVRLKAWPGPGLVSATNHARSLARELRALCDHHDILTGAPARRPA